jgi:carbonic anhydrase
MISARDALERLMDGNRRFVTEATRYDKAVGDTCRQQIRVRQEPFAIILGCSDSRVPPEIIFDQGLGELFVVRVAGNVATPAEVGSVEFAAEELGTRLVVVLGHSGCGAILATLKELANPSSALSSNLQSIVDPIRSSIEGLLLDGAGRISDEMVTQAVRANIRASANHLRHGSEILEKLAHDAGLLIVGAEYSLESGVVEFIDGVPETG